MVTPVQPRPVKVLPLEDVPMPLLRDLLHLLTSGGNQYYVVVIVYQRLILPVLQLQINGFI